MKPIIIKLITGFFVVFLSLSVFTQEVVFIYDDAGNRNERYILWEENINDSTHINLDTTCVKNDQIIEEELEKYSAQIGEQTLNIFPNPNHGVFIITIDGWQKNTEVDILLFDLSGTVILEKTLNQAVAEVKFGDRPDGTYILTIMINGKKETWKVVKK